MTPLNVPRYTSQACTDRKHRYCPRTRGAAIDCACNCHVWVKSGVRHKIDVDAARKRAYAQVDVHIGDTF